ncbi:MAG: ribonuclease P protein subunit [Candidatus Micrarchaeota archaeon]
MITRKNLILSTFIGLEVEVSNSSARGLVGLKGTVVDETKNLIVIEKADGKEVKVPKISSSFRFTLEDGDRVTIGGSSIAFRPHERPKKAA